MTEPRDEARDVLAEAMNIPERIEGVDGDVWTQYRRADVDETLERLAARGYRLAATPEPAPDVEALRTLSDAATPGPWKADGPDVFDEGGEISIDVVSPAGLLACLPTGVMALTEKEYEPILHKTRWQSAIDTQATPDAAFLAAAANFVRAALHPADPSRSEP